MKIRSKIPSKLGLLAALILLTVPGLAWGEAVSFGHGGMYTSKYVDGANLILLTDNSHGTESGTPIIYNLRLYDMTGQPIPFQTAQVSFTQGDKTLYRKDVPLSPSNDIVLTYTVPKQGIYALRVYFIDHGKQISQATFPINAAKGPNQGFLVNAFTLQTALAFILGAGVLYLYGQRRNLKPVAIRLVARTKKRPAKKLTKSLAKKK